ncbi:MAG: transposase [Nitrospirales bacterium]|nr:transposase [Nitrospirales bacterium]
MYVSQTQKAGKLYVEPVRLTGKLTYTPEQNGLIERFFRSLKEECVWQQQFESFEEGQKAINRWIRWYNEGRPHQALQYRSPRQYRNEQRSQVA